MVDVYKSEDLLLANASVTATDQFKREIEQFMARAFGTGMHRETAVKALAQSLCSTAPQPAEISPAIDIHETPTALEVTAELPGLRASEIEVTMQDGYLILRGQKQSHRDLSGALRFRERSYGRFSRAVALPEAVVADRISARLDNGILRVTLPKAAPGAPGTTAG